MPDTLAAPRGPRHLIDPLAAVDTSEGLREFRSATERMGIRFPLRGAQDMRADKRDCPHMLVTKFLAAGRLSGQPRAWGERMMTFVRTEIDRLWNTDLPTLNQARKDAEIADAAEGIATTTALIDNSLDALEREYASTKSDIAAETVRLEALGREIARRRHAERVR